MIMKKKLFSQFPLGYRESLIIVFIILIIGFILQLITNTRITPPSFPRNLLIIIFFIVYIVITYLFVKHPLIQWLSSIPAAVSAITGYTLLILLMGFIPQGKNNPFTIFETLGLTHIISSCEYLLITIYLLTVLGYTVVKRLRPFTFRNFAFFLNHAGLWLIISSASLGSGDIIRLVMPVNEGETIDIAFDEHKNAYKMPFAIKLLDFKIEEYPPQKMASPAVKSYSSDIIISSADGEQYKTQVLVNKPYSFKRWKIYQYGYDEKMWKESKLSIFEVLKDPWLNVVYIGIYMLLGGAVLLLWIEKSTKH